MMGLDAGELRASRSGEFTDARVTAALRFAVAVSAKRGHVSDEDIAGVRAAGYDDADIAAIVGHVALNVPTN
jgi:alkylhydroperoxidase family enzyme